MVHGEKKNEETRLNFTYEVRKSGGGEGGLILARFFNDGRVVSGDSQLSFSNRVVFRSLHIAPLHPKVVYYICVSTYFYVHPKYTAACAEHPFFFFDRRGLMCTSTL